MKTQQTDRVLLIIAMISYLLMSVSFLLMPIEALAQLPGVLFWGGLAAGSVLLMILEGRRRSFFATYGVNRQTMQKPHNGLLSFGSNAAAKLADRLMLGSVVLTGIVLLITKGFGYICNILIAVTVFSSCMHCILNGRIYFHTNNQNKVRRVLEQRKENSKKEGEGTV